MRPMATGSRPVTSVGIGKRLASKSSSNSTPAAWASKARASATGKGSANSMFTASEWARSTGTRTQVAERRRSGNPMILRVSLSILSSSSQ